jgi:hypothetical protein
MNYSAVSRTTKWPFLMCCRTHPLLSIQAKLGCIVAVATKFFYFFFYLLVVSLGFALFHIPETKNFEVVPGFFENF